MIPDFLSRLFGSNWRTSCSAIVAVVFGFIAVSPEMFHGWPVLVGLSKYLAAGGFIGHGLASADAKSVKTLSDASDANEKVVQGLSDTSAANEKVVQKLDDASKPSSSTGESK